MLAPFSSAAMLIKYALNFSTVVAASSIIATGAQANDAPFVDLGYVKYTGIHNATLGCVVQVAAYIL